MEKNRNTGRTSRIASFVVDQLYTTGQVIVTDHIQFEYPNSSLRSLDVLIERVKFLLHYNNKKLNYEIEKLFNVYIIKFELK